MQDEFRFNKYCVDKDGNYGDGSKCIFPSRVAFKDFKYNEHGFTPDGYNFRGYDENGFNKEGYDYTGYSVDGFDVDGYSVDGYDINGYDKNDIHFFIKQKLTTYMKKATIYKTIQLLRERISVLEDEL